MMVFRRLLYMFSVFDFLPPEITLRVICDAWRNVTWGFRNVCLVMVTVLTDVIAEY